MLDNYSKHCDSISSINVSDILEKDDNDNYLYSERDRVTLCGMISSLTLKTTKNQEQMAFFQLEDRYASCECIVFSKKYAELYPDIFLDNAVCVEGTISIRDEEAPKILINAMYSLTENERYVPKKSEIKPAANDSVQSAPAFTSDTANEALNMYLSIYQSAGVEQHPSQSVEKPVLQRQTPQTPMAKKTPTKIYVRVPDMYGNIFLKAKNAVDIFNEGTVRVIFYGSAEQKYAEYSERLNFSEYVYVLLCEIAGKDNVVVKYN